MNINLKPGILLTLSFIFGIIIYGNFNITLSFLLVFFYLIMLGKLMNVEFKNLLLSFLFIIIGIISMLSKEKFYLNALDNENVEIIGVVNNCIEKKDNNEYIIKNVLINGNKYNKKILIKDYNKENNYALGDKIEIFSKFRIPKKNKNPKMFDYKKYLATKNIFGYINLYENNSIQLVKKNTNTIYFLKEKTQNKIESFFNKNLDYYGSRLLNSIFLGKNYLETEEIDVHKNLGISHILAISGLHINIINIIIIFILLKFNIGKAYGSIISLMVIIIYAYIINFPISIVRALLYISIMTITSVLKLPRNKINTLFLTGFIILFFNPYNIYNVGFQFSFISVFSIIIFDKYLKQKISSKIGKDIALSSFLYLMILPIQLYYFNELTLNFIIGNIFFVPIYVLIIVLGFLALIFYFIGNLLLIYKPILILINLLTNLLELMYSGIDIILLNTIKIHSFNIYEILLYYIIIFLLIFKFRFISKINYKNKMNILKYILLSNIFVYITIYFSNPITVNYIDIGQGNAALVQTIDKSYLLDTGGNIFKEENYLNDYLIKNGVYELNNIFITHFDYDHSGNLQQLDRDYKLNITGKENGLKTLNDYNIKYSFNKINNKKNINLDKFSVFIYNKEETDNENENSLVYKININGYNLLFPGDISKKIEIKLLKENIESEILLVPHHGSNTSSSTEFIKKVNPKYAIISVGENNLYNHPNEEVVKEYKDKNIEIYRTDINGNISVYIDKFGYNIKSTMDMFEINDFINIRNSIIIFYVFYFYLFVNKTSKRKDII